jgi:hypothetical protein
MFQQTALGDPADLGVPAEPENVAHRVARHRVAW